MKHQDGVRVGCPVADLVANNVIGSIDTQAKNKRLNKWNNELDLKTIEAAYNAKL